MLWRVGPDVPAAENESPKKIALKDRESVC